MAINQSYLFLIFTVNGFIIGMLFDFFRILRKTFKTSDFITYIQDIIFWILTGLLILYSIFQFNNGEIRLYMFLGIGIGAILYLLLISKYVVKISVAILCKIKEVIQKIIKIVLFPIKATAKICQKIIEKINITTKIKKIFQKMQKNLLKTKGILKKT